ncbi:MAG: type II toxin-antitoxin system Phd/YefM family antitoxin [Armatimonadota bacterium]|nr:type II toxin-antitoxin system Phd/YefM family antitoxin [Armatimonadota bacterium]MDR7487174.1 type II toxin-antitoxin system Phd/YefM family antitoxin [Armatimonadota bacterium]MDR7533382.1 type II toxin-antitoxin system Phd/YefM family antitoxin [Armatimonadota bacterium]MDR7536502.1 type II toxin-antitoxin system Phd/YefM family antitoxin [Armatimonadota bacterium]
MPGRRRVTVTEAVRNFSELLGRVRYKGERFVLLKGGKPVAELVPTQVPVRLGELPAILADLPHLDAEDAGRFEADLDAVRRETVPRTTPWVS